MRYAQIRSMDISNGEGIGVALFVQGCHFHCENCFNQETWDFDGGKLWTSETQNQFLDLIAQPHITRVSILGGEPLADENVFDIFQLLSLILGRFAHSKKIWIYTGYNYETILDKYKKSFNDMSRALACCCADVIVDGRYKEKLKDYKLHWRGSSNQRVIDVQATLKTGKIVLYTE